jgi:hypothetical protein
MRMRAMLGLIGFAAGTAWCAPSDLDPGWGIGGSVSGYRGPIELEASGDLVASRDEALFRLTRAGAVDSGFGAAGSIVPLTGFVKLGAYAHQTDGRFDVVLVGALGVSGGPVQRGVDEVPVGWRHRSLVSNQAPRRAVPRLQPC